MDHLVCVALGWQKLTDGERAILEGIEKTFGFRQFDEFNLPYLMKTPNGMIRPASAISQSLPDAMIVFKEYAPKCEWAIQWHATFERNSFVPGYNPGWFIADSGESKFISLSGCAAATIEHAIAKALLLSLLVNDD